MEESLSSIHPLADRNNLAARITETENTMAQLDFTLTAGPTMASTQTLQALGSPMMYHYDPQFVELFRRTQAKAQQFFQTENDLILMQGEGILGLEAAARAMTIPGMHVLNLVQGMYGKGMGFWLTAFGGVLHEIEVPYNEAVSPAAVDEYLTAHPEIKLVTMVHSETPSGTVTDCEKIGPIAHKHGALTLVDALSSIGGSEFLTDEWKLDVVVSGGQKCLGGPVGITMMSVSEAAWERVFANELSPRDSYISMIDWKVKWLEKGVFPYTPSVNDIVGIESALTQILDEGVDQAVARHAAAARVARAGVLGLGLKLWAANEDIASNVVTSVLLPESVKADDVSAHIRARYGVMMSTAVGAGNIIHVTHMGPSARGMYTIVSISALAQGLSDLGAEVNVGAGVQAALAQLATEQE